MRRKCFIVGLAVAACGPERDEPAVGPVDTAAAHSVEANPTPSEQDLATAEREHVRALLESACGQCHIGGSSQQPAALAVFDLRDPDFTARMTDEQLEAMPDRIDGMGLDPEAAAAILAYVSTVFADRRATDPRDC